MSRRTLDILLITLHALGQRCKGDFLLQEGVLLLNGVPLVDLFPTLTAPQRRTRANYFARQLGLAAADLDVLAVSWRHELAAGITVPSSRFIELGHAASRGQRAEPDVLGPWRKAMLNRLQKAMPHALTDGDMMDISNRSGPLLDTAALLRTWPLTLLYDPAWSQAEAPLPNLRPLSLDETWVDVQFIPPDELGFGEDFLASLDQRYEERRWRAEPAEWLVERLGASTALIGAPGIGKTTFLKWLARRLLRQDDGRFMLPLFVPLRRYVLERERQAHQGGFLDYALHIAGVTDAGQVALWHNALAYLSGVQADCVLLLLDGWDEVPLDQRERLQPEIAELRQVFSFVITSRPSGFPRSLPVNDFHEITELAPGSINLLVQRWFKAVDQPNQGAALLAHLDHHADLHRLARNPFLLILLCGIAYQESGQNHLPNNRTELYQRALDQLRAQHTSRSPSAPFDSVRERQAVQLAWWLMHDAPGAPRYVFNIQEAMDCSHDRTLLPEVLQPSRLLSQWDSSTESIHFIHTTFQEYLAALALANRSAETVRVLIDSHGHDGAWQEVLRFVAASAPHAQHAFWQVMTRLVAKPDRYGLIYARVARFVAESGAKDGGLALVGIDLREALWSCLRNDLAITHLTTAYAELDANAYVDRVKTYAERHPGKLANQLVRTLRLVRGAAASQLLVSQILGSDDNVASVAALAAGDVLDLVGRELLRAAAIAPQRSIAQRNQAIRALGYARDASSVELLHQLARQEQPLRRNALRALGHIGGDTAANLLGDWILATTDQVQTQEELIEVLGRFREPAARDWLMRVLAHCAPDSALVPAVLEALAENPISWDAGLILEYLHSSEPALRQAAAWALAEASESGVVDALAQTAQKDTNPEVRHAAVSALRKRARPSDAAWLVARIQDSSCDSAERANTLEAMLFLAARYAHRDHGDWLRREVLPLATAALSTPGKDMNFAAAAHAHLLGAAMVAPLMQVCQDRRFGADVREVACTSLGKLRAREATPVLLNILREAPDAPSDEDAAQTSVAGRLASAAAQALAQIDPASLLYEPGRAAQIALARFATESGRLVYADHIQSATVVDQIDPSGGLLTTTGPLELANVNLPGFNFALPTFAAPAAMPSFLPSPSSSSIEAPMRIGITGSWTAKKHYPYPLRSDLATFNRACRDIGIALAAVGASVVVGSDSPSTADRPLVEGYLEGDWAPHSIRVIRPSDDHQPFQNLYEQHPGAFVFLNTKENSRRSTRRQSVADVDAMLTIGGGYGTYQVGLETSQAKKQLIPIGSFGGASGQLLRNLLGTPDLKGPNRYEKLNNPWVTDLAPYLVALIMELVQNKGNAPASKLLMHVSYAWGGESETIVDKLETRLKDVCVFKRDRSAMRPGDWISKFMTEIGQSQCVLVVLSDKYLKSPYCMRELLYLHQTSLGDKAAMLERIVPIVLSDAKIDDQVARLAVAQHWKKERERLEAATAGLHPLAWGDSTRHALMMIHDFEHHSADMLTWAADVLMPRGAALEANGFDVVAELLQRRCKA